jgi:acylphosphatase
VGFRYTAQNVAMQFNVRGFVRNLNDGRVELVAEGPDDQVKGLLEAIQGRMQGFITRLDAQDSPGTGEFQGFSIRH